MNTSIVYQLVGQTYIFANNGGAATPATLERADPQRLIALDHEWSGVAPSLATAAASTGNPQHSHWNWSEKGERLAYLAYQGFVLVVEGQMQGVLILENTTHRSRLPVPNRPLIYVDYVASAPWNLKMYTNQPQFQGVGASLMELAIQVSRKEGFGGRVGLHSLPQAERFYRDTCKMTEFERDPNYYDLRYFEFSEQNANAFVNGRS